MVYLFILNVNSGLTWSLTQWCLFAALSVLTPAPKTYSLTNTAQVDTGGVSDKSILKVSQKSYYIVSSSFHV